MLRTPAPFIGALERISNSSGTLQRLRGPDCGLDYRRNVTWKEDHMRKVAAVLGLIDLRRVGACPRCMKASFCSAAIAWLGAVGLSLIGSDTWSIALVTFAVVLSSLWLAHVVARATRILSVSEPHDSNRRLTFKRTAKALTSAVVVSVAVGPWAGALADSGCGGWAGNSGCLPCRPCDRQRANCECYECASCGQNCSGHC